MAARPRKTVTPRRSRLDEVQRSVDALFTYWRAGIRWKAKERSHREPSDAQVAGELAHIGNDDFVAPLLRELREWEQYTGKLTSTWTTEERRNAALFVTNVLDRVRAQVFERRRGAPKSKRVGRGLINSHMTFPSPRESARAERRKHQSELPSFAASVKLGTKARQLHDDYIRGGATAKDALELFGSLDAATKHFRKLSVRADDVDKALSGRLVASEFVNAYALPKRYEGRIRKLIERKLRPQILAELTKRLKK